MDTFAKLAWEGGLCNEGTCAECDPVYEYVRTLENHLSEVRTIATGWISQPMLLHGPRMGRKLLDILDKTPAQDPS